jgi:hypothetical protein
MDIPYVPRQAASLGHIIYHSTVVPKVSINLALILSQPHETNLLIREKICPGLVLAKLFSGKRVDSTV